MPNILAAVIVGVLVVVNEGMDRSGPVLNVKSIRNDLLMAGKHICFIFLEITLQAFFLLETLES